MKKIYFLVIVTFFSSLLLCSCNKTVPRSDHPFTLDINKVRNDGVCTDIIPENNDFRYLFSVFPAEAIDAFAGKEKEFIKLIDDGLKGVYASITGDIDLSEFEQKVLYNGAYMEYIYDLTPDTEYYLAAFSYTGIEPDETITKTKFKTSKYIKSDISFDIKVDGARIEVVPSNSDTYFYDFARKEDLEKEKISVFSFHKKLSQYYWEEDFFPSKLLSGNSTSDLNEYYATLTPGDQFYFSISGYNDGINSDIQGYLITYNGSDKPGTVTRITEE